MIGLQNPDSPTECVEIFRNVAAMMKKAKKFVAVTGAGISVSAGIPDFRSENGLYNLVKNRYPNVVLKGKDLFDASLFRDPASTNLFFEFMAELKGLSDAAAMTPTHTFLKNLEHQGRLLRWYTQVKPSLFSELAQETASSQSAPPPLKRSSSIGHTGGPVLVQLHGSLDAVVCSLCVSLYPYDDDHHSAFSTGAAPQCPRCIAHQESRTSRGKRGTAVGALRPNVVLYGEHHEGGAAIAQTALFDTTRRRFDVLLVMGTSLKVDGVRKLVRDLAAGCRTRGGKVVLVNRNALGKEWDNVFDYLLLGDCDTVVEELGREWERPVVRRRASKLGKATVGAVPTVPGMQPMGIMLSAPSGRIQINDKGEGFRL
ncbi:DHS-like NAD/FAD-binding domain-containing protein [Chytridium lagenaria]|nr:DHS-like NAD/FAD-binding domain-containing protein [Chytridium lagenaria]